MKRKRHKRKLNQVMIVTPDTVDADVKQYKVHPWLNGLIVAVMCIFVGTVIGYIIFENQMHSEQTKQEAMQEMKLQELAKEQQGQLKELEDEIAKRDETIQILSDTVNQKTAQLDQLSEKMEGYYLPTGFPLSKSATMAEQNPEEEPKCVFTATPGAMVIATGSGTVMAVNDDPDYGHNVWIDHGNGYLSVYRNSGDIKVKQGEKVNQGNTLFLIGADNCKMEYQMLLDGVHIDPMEMLEISG